MVYHGIDGQGADAAVKIFDELAISRRCLAEATEQLNQDGWPQGVIPVLGADFFGKPAVRVTPLMADEDGRGGWKPRSLQHQWNDWCKNRAKAWPLLEEIAKTLSRMHERKVAHGNLKPGNVLFDHGGNALLTDWALGNMPGLEKREYTDAELYQPPEQLLHPEGWYQGEVLRWDVYAFGVLAFRLLTGSFPRCDATFRLVAPQPGETHMGDIVADLATVAKNLKASPEPNWPDPATDALESERRALIDRCLHLDPKKRPPSMIEVAKEFHREMAVREAVEEIEQLLDTRRSSERKAWGARVVALLALAAAGGAGYWAYQSRAESEQMTGEARRAVSKKDAAVIVAEDARKQMEDARRSQKEAEDALAKERAQWALSLKASREWGDDLFEDAMHDASPRLPGMMARPQRLERMDVALGEFLKETMGKPEFADERLRAEMAWAEIALAQGNASEAGKRLEAVRERWLAQHQDAESRLRWGRDLLAWAILRQKAGDPGAQETFVQARAALETVPAEQIDGRILARLRAVLDVNEAGLLASKGDQEKALERLISATSILNGMADQRPDAIAVRSELASTYLASAEILDGLDRLGDAREARTMASNELRNLVKEKPTDFNLRSQLAGTLAAMADAASTAGDVAAAWRLAEESTKILQQLRSEQPGHVEVMARLASQKGLMAGMLNDQGRGDEASKLLDEGIGLLEKIAAEPSSPPLARYRLALLWWQKGRVYGYSGNRGQEREWENKALAQLRSLESGSNGVLKAEEVQRSMAYLLGDIGHSAYTDNKIEEARKIFNEAVKVWDGLITNRPESDEYKEGLSWSKQRLKELGK